MRFITQSNLRWRLTKRVRPVFAPGCEVGRPRRVGRPCTSCFSKCPFRQSSVICVLNAAADQNCIFCNPLHLLANFYDQRRQYLIGTQNYRWDLGWDIWITRRVDELLHSCNSSRSLTTEWSFLLRGSYVVTSNIPDTTLSRKRPCGRCMRVML